MVALLEHGLANPPEFVGEVEYGRVLLQYPRVRWEAFGKRPPGQQPERMVLWVYQDGIWSSMVPPDPAEKRFTSLFYREDRQPVRVPPLGAILGLGVPNFAGGGTLGLDSVHAKSGQLYWRDWFEHFIRVSETENRQGKLLLRFKSRTCTPGGTPVLLANLFFEREPPHLLTRLELEAAYGEGKHRVTHRVIWRDFQSINGEMIPTEVETPILVDGFVPSAGKPVEDWEMVGVGFEEYYWVFKVTELAVNPDVDKVAFELPAPPAGAGVVDLVRGETYRAGDAGEVLERESLKGRRLLEQGPPEGSWLTWAAWGGAAASLLILAGWMLWRWRASA